MLAEYQTRSKRIRAIRYIGHNKAEIHKLVGRLTANVLPHNQIGLFRGNEIGFRVVNVGDWVVEEAPGRFIPMSHASFDDIYEPVNA